MGGPPVLGAEPRTRPQPAVERGRAGGRVGVRQAGHVPRLWLVEGELGAGHALPRQRGVPGGGREGACLEERRVVGEKGSVGLDEDVGADGDVRVGGSRRGIRRGVRRGGGPLRGERAGRRVCLQRYPGG